MTFDGDIYPFSRFYDFVYYSDEDGTNGKITESLTSPGGQPWKIGTIKVHLSSVFASVEYLKVYISSVNGSYHNYVILSQLMSGVQDLLVQFSQNFLLHSNDQVIFSWSLVSGVNLFGLEVRGWAVQG